MAGHFIFWFSFPEDGNFIYRVSLVAQLVKNLPAMQETQVQSLGGENPLEKETATHSSILAWGIPWTKRGLVGYSPRVAESDMSE